MRGRIDLLITDRRVGQHLLDELNIRNKITENPTIISQQSQFLAVRRNAGMDLLVQRFGAELKRFKREPAYAELSARYGAAPANHASTPHEPRPTRKKPLSSRKAARSDCSVILRPSRQAHARTLGIVQGISTPLQRSFSARASAPDEPS